MSQCIAGFYDVSSPITVYTGLSDTVGDSSLSSYKWTVDNTAVTYDNFQPGEPGSTAERCVVMHSSYHLKWFRWTCTIATKGLCEANLVSD